MSNNKISSLLVLATALGLSAGVASAQQPGDANWKSTAANAIWKNASGQCWRSGFWTPALAIAECDPDLVTKPAPPPPPPPAAAPAPRPAPAPAKPAPAPAPKPAPAPAPKPVAQKVTLSADVLFDFDKAVVKPAGIAKLDDLLGKIKGVDLEVIIAIGHTDSIGSVAYNQRLSERRANAVKAYLVSKGIAPNRVYVEGKGEKQPVASNKTSDGRQKNRRVDIEVIGTRK